MAFIEYVPESSVAPDMRVSDPDNIIQVHRIHPEVMRLHHDLYLELMHRRGALSRVQKEMVAVVVSGINGCYY